MTYTYDAYDNVATMRAVRLRAKSIMATDSAVTFSAALEMALDALRAEGS